MEAPSVFIRVSNVSLNNFELSNYCHVLFLIPRLHVKFGMINEEKKNRVRKAVYRIMLMLCWYLEIYGGLFVDLFICTVEVKIFNIHCFGFALYD